MKYLIGVFIAFVGFYLSSQHLNQELAAYWDFVAFFVVIFGTIAVLLINQPAAPLKILISHFFQKFVYGSPSIKKTGQKCWEVGTKNTTISDSRFIEDRLLNDGLELTSLGFESDKTKEILAHRFFQYQNQVLLLSAWFKRTAKYPPAFGLAGTVLGLIHLMRGISTGIDAKETGIRMAVALVATFYGLIISNLILNPLGEWLAEEVKKDEMKAEMCIETIELLQANANQVEIQERINSYLDPNDRINSLSFSLEAEAT